MNRKNFRAFLAVGALATASATWGCVADRPSRNGVFNENQYIRKDFLVQPADGTGADPGWMMKATIVSASTPNPLAAFNFFVGAESGGAYVRFGVTSDKLQVLSARELGPVDPSQASRVPEVVNAWPVTNVDLKYQVNLDGEKTNFYQENQELDWQVRQWVKVNFDKNDMSDFAPFGEYLNFWVNTCVDVGNVTATLVPSTFQVDEPNNYMSWQVQFTLPLKWQDQACYQAMDSNAAEDFRNFRTLGRSSVTMNMLYSFARATPQGADGKVGTYVPLEIGEKDPIQHKYGPIAMNTITRDPESQLLASRQLVIRFDPTQTIQWYFAPGYPEDYKKVFTDPGGIVDQTNGLLTDAGVTARLSILNNDDDKVLGDHAGPIRQYGDLRYSFIRWESDLDTGSPFLAVTQFMPDPRTGQAISASINVAGFPIKEYVVERVNAYLKSIGAAPQDSDILDGTPWPAAPANYVPDPAEKMAQGAKCIDGDVAPLDDSTGGINQTVHNQSSTLLAKMQGYLQRPLASNPPLGTKDFIATQNDNFYNAYFALAPYVVFADPLQNFYVTPEGGSGVYGPVAMAQMYRDQAEFMKHASDIDHGYDPFDGVSGQTGLQNATSFMNRMRNLVLNNKALEYAKMTSHPHAFFDTADVVSMQGIMQKDARHCIDGQWETKQQWLDSVISSYWSLVVWHEFGHALGLEHNYMGSVDKPNYPTYQDHATPPRTHVGMYQSSVMEYNNTPDRIFWKNDTGAAGWGPYDKGAITWIYANNAPVAVPADAKAKGISGQVSATMPWKDPHGFAADGTTEKQFLFCNEKHMAYTPLCRTFDSGATPSEIIANSIDYYEWQYKWRNYRQYFKIWNDGPYALAVQGLPIEMRRFLSLWVFDWNGGALPDTFRRVGIVPPAGVPAVTYYNEIGNYFDSELSAAASMTAAFHNAVMQQSNGERPVATIYDKYFGDVTQQGIILDKYFAMLDWTGLWPTTNYDLNQAGVYLASYEGLGDSFFNSISEQTVTTMVGGGYDSFPWFVPSAVAMFAQDTHSPSFGGRVDVRDWIGGHVFYRLEDFLTYFRDIAVQNALVPFSTQGTTTVPGSTTPVTIFVDSTSGLSVGDAVTVDGGLSEEQSQVLNISAANNEITLVLTKPHSGTYPVLGQACTSVDVCRFDPRKVSDNHNEFIGPDKRKWSWAYVADRNVWVAVQKERNTASYIILRNYNDDIIGSQDDGAYPGNAYGLQLPIKYTLDAFNTYN